MAKHRLSRSSKVKTNPLRRRVDPSAAPSTTEVTDIIAFDEFGSLDDLDFRDNAAFDNEVQVLLAPGLDDLCDADDISPVRLAAPTEFRRRGKHHAPSTTSAVKGRLLIAAMATGAAAAAAHSAVNNADTQSNPAVLASDQSPIGGAAIEKFSGGVQLVTVTPAAKAALHQEELANGMAFAQDRAEREARLQRPLFVMPARGIPTSGFGFRWGALHGGIDVANSIGTPIRAVSDGIVIEAGPYGGYGNMVKLRHSDGTVTLYGHLNSISVSVGERVYAGDPIATMGNTGNSTGPHLHFEVHLNGSNRINPVPWLAQRGISMGGFTG